MQARFYDGVTSAAHGTQVSTDREALSFGHAGHTHRWALARLEVEKLGDRVRLAAGDGGMARLVVATDDWRVFAGDLQLPKAWRRPGELRLIGGLIATAAVVGLVVFVGIPMASGPLARATPLAYERKLGASFEQQLAVAFKPCQGVAGQDALWEFGYRLRQPSDGDRMPFRVQAVEAPMANAFALPGGAIMVTDDLIAMTRTPDELAAVIAHEAAHVERRHVMQAVWRSLGFGLILDAVVGGGSGAGQQAVLLAGSVSDLRYSRDAEREADARGQELLHAQGLSSQGMAPFFTRLAVKGEKKEVSAVREFVSTHPDSARRAGASRRRAQPGLRAFTPAQWDAIKSVCRGQDRPFRIPGLRRKSPAP